MGIKNQLRHKNTQPVGVASKLGKNLKKAAAIFLSLIVVGALLVYALSAPIPEGTEGPEADALANQMLSALNVEGFNQLKTISFSYGGHYYLWNKAANKVDVSWGDYQAALDLDDLSNSEAYQNGKAVEKKQALIDKAIAYFYNDSYWLAAPYKVYDKGVERRVVNTENGTKALLVTHTTGGVTPGDSYLWLLDDTYRPTAFKMWVSIIPIGGVKASWEDYEIVSGVPFATRHRMGPLSLFIKNLDGKPKTTD
jgi:hypothetical protein